MNENTNEQLPTNSLPTLQQLRSSEQHYYAKKHGEKPAAPLTEKAQQYMAKMQASAQSQRDTSIAALMQQVQRRPAARRFVPYPYTCQAAYPLALALYRKRLAAVGRELLWQSDSEAVFRGLVQYFVGNSAGPYELHRGIYLFGGFGVGKTIMMQALQDFTKLIEERLTAAGVDYTPRTFRFNHTKDIAMELQRTGSTAALQPYTSGARLFDDLGNEDEKKLYGNDVNAMAEILTTRYNAWQHGGPATHCTSNLPPDKCRAIYGERIGSRVFELFNHVYLDGEDRRRGN